MSKTREVIGDAGAYSSALLLTQFITVIASFVTRRFLGPTNMGAWSLVQVWLSFAEYVSLGTLAAITLQIPFYNGKGDTKKAESIKNTVFSFSILSSAMLSAGVLVYAFVCRGSLEPGLFIGLCFMAALVILQRVNGLFISLIRAYKKFALAGRQMLYSAVVNAVLVAVLSYRYRLYGFLTAVALSFIFNIVYIARHQKFDFKVSLEKSELRSLIAYGVPLMVITLFTTFFETIDRMMIARYLGLEALGLYGIGLMAFNYINSVPNAVTVVTIPNVQEKYGQTGNYSDLQNFLNRSDDLAWGIISVLIGLAWFILPLLVQAVLPQFVAGIPSMRFLILGTYFIALGQAYLQVIYVVKKQAWILLLTGIACLAALALNWFAIRRGFGIEGVAVATASAIALNCALIRSYASKQMSMFHEFPKKFLWLLLRFSLMLAWLLTLTYWIRFSSPLWTAAAQTALFLAAYIPFFVESNKRFGLVSLFQRKIFKREAAHV